LHWWEILASKVALVIFAFPSLTPSSLLKYSLPSDNVVELRNSQHVLDGHGVPIFFAERRYAIRYALFPIGILFVLQNVVHISENLLGDVGWQWTEKRKWILTSERAADALTEPEFPRK
jgi:hypothetical protein